MATRRIVNAERTLLEKDDPIEEKSNIAPAVPNDVIFKLLAFTFAMIVVPIGGYFVTVNTVFKGTVHFTPSFLYIPGCLDRGLVSREYSNMNTGNASFAGGFAALLANVVLVGYIIVAMKEDQSETTEKKKPESKKDK
ncbi:unnamed protein product [Clonostachys byssicola]|uniref:Vacuolar ATPase assembly integral membrane protein VMA21 n=1 Tax=Clonostachys byssicola TaxID=160290 RepID=A0A9N9UVL3_9HYPO|nr:unnamed protein product [Clonostachys byssicola]